MNDLGYSIHDVKMEFEAVLTWLPIGLLIKWFGPI